MPLQLPATIRATDGATLAVRELRAGDAPAMQAFHAALNPDSRDKFTPHAYDGDTLAKCLERAAERRDLLLGAWDDTTLAGYFFLWYFDDRVPLLGIGMLDAWQHRGLGRRMMEILIAAAKANGNEGVELTTMQHNHNAFALYRRVGFTYIGDVANQVGDGRVVVERAMFLPLVPDARPMDRPHAPPV